jgi:Polyketide cyclase / dehydrase and lipid transport
MASIEVREPIAVPPEHVFVFFVPQRMPYWYGVEMDSHFDMMMGCGADFSVGSAVRISGRVGNKAVSQTAVVTAYEYGHLLEWNFQDEYGVRGKERWELERVAPPDAGGEAGGVAGTVVRFTSDYVMPGRFGRLVDWVVTRHAVARRSREYLQRLARLAEHRGEFLR